MGIEYYWLQGEIRIIESMVDSIGMPDPLESKGVRLSFSEFRDLVQCQSRGGLIATSNVGRPQVLGREKSLLKKR